MAGLCDARAPTVLHSRQKGKLSVPCARRHMQGLPSLLSATSFWLSTSWEVGTVVSFDASRRCVSEPTSPQQWGVQSLDSQSPGWHLASSARLPMMDYSWV